MYYLLVLTTLIGARRIVRGRLSIILRMSYIAAQLEIVRLGKGIGNELAVTTTAAVGLTFSPVPSASTLICATAFGGPAGVLGP